MKFFFISAFLILNVLNIVKSFPFGKNVRLDPLIPTGEQLRFMQRFGYIDGGQPGYEAQYTEKAIHEAVLNIQKFGAIEQTGFFDEKTIQLMSKRRCGVKDIIHKTSRKKRYTILSKGWKKREITYFISNWCPALGEQSVAREIKRGLNTWAPYGNITFIRTNNPNADIVVAFGIGNHGDPFPFDGPGNILAHAFFPYVSYGGGIHFDNDESWTTSKLDDEDETTDFFSVAVHELGHSLGLAHSTVPNSIMFPYYKGHGSDIQLDYDDVMAMYEIYIKSQFVNDGQVILPKRKSTEDSPSIRTTQENIPESTNEESTTTEHPTTTKQFHEVTFHGDDETVDDHKRHDTKYSFPIAEVTTPKPPNICDGNYDAVAVLRQELFVFKENNVWRVKVRGKIEDNYPVNIQTLFPNLPSSISKIDAAYERLDGSIAFFSGSSYWIHTDITVSGPYSFTTYELPSNLDAIDAVFVWEKNKLTYLFKGDQFWRFNESTRRLDEDYPKNITRWRGIPGGIDAAITWTDGSTYFFKGSLYWRFDDTYIKADRHYPLPAPQYWFKCPESSETLRQLPAEILSRGYMEH